MQQLLREGKRGLHKQVIGLHNQKQWNYLTYQFTTDQLSFTFSGVLSQNILFFNLSKLR